MTEPTALASDTVLKADGLHKAYNGKPALKGVSLSLQAGEMVALLGPNGAGKSTLLQLLTGLFTPDQGTITVLGHDMRQQPARALAGLGVVFQQSALDLDLTVMANLLFHTDLHGIPRQTARERIAAQLAAIGLQDQTKAVVRSLSGGTRRKVELVRALLHRPRLLLMDEATVGLDPASRQQLLDTVRGLCRDHGLAVLWATHLIEEVKTADRLLLLHQGTVRFDGAIGAFMAAAEGSDFQTEVLKALQKPGL
ncbi:ABC transporter ATP-binding protein [Hydrogenophaga pseudoflava]|uniref:Daunorubicin/doxorubicin resistance ATP-binding protein DrrA n=1 Tax=Hydrogenophaga pseudoflava TaxID=47421 RepID=A0A4P6X2Z5_HYDPS|nr:ABC transporter ATP-binding protein [Hydrogenophaga pseudoflava]QBM29509.1 Daunorubicin/doxorubicin resistance ATP-binding protein DrrA [Hydrogenophaga pseudoflava]